MIKVNKNKVMLEGNAVDLASEVTMAVKHYIKALEEVGFTREEAVNITRESVELAFKTEEEVHAEAKKILAKVLKEFCEGIINEGEEGEKDYE